MVDDADESGVSLPRMRRTGHSRRSRSHRPKRSSGRRAVFFALAAMWGFIVGVTGLLAATYSFGQPMQPSAGVVLCLIPISALALGGGVVTAWAYGETRSRSR